MMDMYTADDITLIIGGYKENPYLEECIQSLMRQTVRCPVIISTSTPCLFLDQMAKKYQLEVFTNDEPEAIGNWNFGIRQVKTPLVTIVHQDDIYEPEYVEEILNAANSSRRPLIAFTDSFEVRDGERVYQNRLLRVKRMLLFPLRAKLFRGSKFVRRRSLSLGNGICCPAVTYVRANLSEPIFTSDYRCNQDWDTWEQISKLDGDFLYVPKPLVGHRISAGSGTTLYIADGRRRAEDLEMFEKFWPKGIAKALARFYALAEKSNEEN